ncbi:hypothetical protein, partial [Actinobacillus pleuropneumoniae]
IFSNEIDEDDEALIEFESSDIEPKEEEVVVMEADEDLINGFMFPLMHEKEIIGASTEVAKSHVVKTDKCFVMAEKDKCQDKH